MPLILLFALVRCHASVFAAQALVGSDYCISIGYDIPMLDNIFVIQASVFAAQALVESDCGISRRYAVASRVGFRA